MIINGHLLLKAAPIKDMLQEKVQAEPTSYGLTECGYDIRIKQDVVFLPNEAQPFSIHPVDQVRIIHPGGFERQHYGRLVLASSVEEFQMPSHLMGRVLNKSTWARRGLDASMTTNIEPGWNGFLTIELIYHGSEKLHIPAGSGICQVIFETLAVPASYKGKYQNQEDKPVDAKLTSEGWTEHGIHWLDAGCPSMGPDK